MLLFGYLCTAGVYVLTMFTLPVQTALWLVLGVVRYFTRVQPAQPDNKKTEKHVTSQLPQPTQRQVSG